MKRGRPLDREDPYARYTVVCGQAGTGKSWNLREYVKRVYETDPDAVVVVVGSTGVAAWNVGGTTFDSWAFIRPGQALTLSPANTKRFAEVTHLVIDEFSMVAEHKLREVDEAMKKVRRNPFPFGGCHVRVYGDAMQLPPVRARPAWTYFLRTEPHVIRLTRVIRQTDEAWCRALGELSRGDLGQEAWDVLRANPDRPGGRWTRLMLRNDACEEYCLACLADDHPDAETREYVAEDDNLRSEELIRDCPYVRTLRLAVGARVMLRRNVSIGKGLVNGAIGVVIALADDEVTVLFGDCMATFERHKLEIVLPGTDLRASRTQFPLRLAAAITVHKSQGLTLENGVVDAKGMDGTLLYVALSRFRRREDVWIDNLPEEPNFPVDAGALANDKALYNQAVVCAERR